MNDDDVREKVARAMYESDAMVAYMERIRPDETLDDDVRIDGTLNFAKLADAAVAAHLSALGDGGYAVIKIPEPCGCGHEWKAGEDTVFYTPEDEVTDVCFVAKSTGSGEAQLVFTKDPKALAAALLAATAEAGQ